LIRANSCSLFKVSGLFLKNIWKAKQKQNMRLFNSDSITINSDKKNSEKNSKKINLFFSNLIWKNLLSLHEKKNFSKNKIYEQILATTHNK
jgi:hypothetical protein